MMLCFVSLSCLFQVPSSRLTAEPISPALSLSEQAFSADQMLAFAAELMRGKRVLPRHHGVQAISLHLSA